MEALIFLVGTCGKNMCNCTTAPADCSAVYRGGGELYIVRGTIWTMEQTQVCVKVPWSQKRFLYGNALLTYLVGNYTDCCMRLYNAHVLLSV